MKNTIDMNVSPEMIVDSPTLLEHSGDFQGRTHVFLSFYTASNFMICSYNSV
jgi:hypothetical protein